MKNSRNLAIALSVYMAGAFAVAGGLETKGTPLSVPPPIGTYGMGVASHVGLRSLIPPGWKTYIHQSVNLPETMDWAVSDTWLTALDRLAQVTDSSVLVDWDTRSILIRPVAVAEQERSVRAEIAQASVTPLPRLSVPEKPSNVPVVPDKPATPVVAPVAVASAAASPTDSVSVEEPGVFTKALASLAGIFKSQQPSALLAEPKKEETPSTLVAAPEQVAVAVKQAEETPTPTLLPPVVQPEQVPVLLAVTKETAAPVAVAVAPEAVVVSPLKPEVASAFVEALRVPEMSIVRTNPVVALPVTATTQPAIISAAADFAYTQPVALNKPTARKVINAIANRFGLRMVWALSEDVALRGPVTLLSQDAAQDVVLLQKAIGLGTPLAIEVKDGVLLVYRKGASRPAIPGTELVVSGAPNGATESTRVTGGWVSTPLPTMHLEMAAGQTLEDSLTSLARQNGYTVDWRVDGGFQAKRGLSYSANSLAGVLAQVLPALNLSADVYTKNKHIVVMPAAARH